MKCEHITDIYLKAGRSGAIPFSVRIHMLTCSKCRKEIEAFQMIQNSLMEEGPDDIPAEKDLCSSVMQQISLMPGYKEPRISSMKWILAGMVILTGIFLIPFNPSMQWIRNYFGELFDVSLTLVLGLAVSLYCSAFAATHIRPAVLKEKFNRLFQSQI